MKTLVTVAAAAALVLGACTGGSAPTAVKLVPAKATTVADIARAPTDVPAPIRRTTPQNVTIDLETREVTAELEDGTTYSYWTFGGTVPGPALRVRVGDTLSCT